MKTIKSGPFKGYKKNYYKALYLDPPWVFRTRSDKGKGRSPEQHYDCMSLEDLMELPIQDLMAKDCAVFMWIIDTHLPQGLKLLEAWGLEYKTVGFYWAKTNKDGTPFTGMGYWTRANPEQLWMCQPEGSAQCLLATKGAPKRQAKDVKRLIMTPRREHSRKPDETYDRIEALVDGPYLELFARQTREGWHCYGNEVTKFNAPRFLDDDLEALLGDSTDSRVHIQQLIG